MSQYIARPRSDVEVFRTIIGRETEVEAVCRLLAEPDVRLLTTRVELPKV